MFPYDSLSLQLIQSQGCYPQHANISRFFDANFRRGNSGNLLVRRFIAGNAESWRRFRISEKSPQPV